MNTRQLQYATLEAIAPRVHGLILEHEANRGSIEDLWMPSDFERLFKRYVKIPNAATAALVFNTLTEDGLPSFHRLIATYLGDTSVWAKWNGIWTAEESRHGRALGVYLVGCPQVRMRTYDEMLFTYHVEGFYPPWESNPYRLLAYTVMQERATQISHARTARLVKDHDPVLTKMLGKIAKEEGRHCRFYSETFRLILEHDAPGALKALSAEMRSFAMPGAVIPGFSDYTYLAERSGVFTTLDFKEIVEMVIKLYGLRELRLEDLGAESARQEILKFPRLLERHAARVIGMEPRELTFPFLEESSVVI